MKKPHNNSLSASVLQISLPIALILLPAALLAATPTRSPSPRQLSFEDRVSYQRALEQVYWHHRIWPTECPDPKPSLNQVMSEAQIEQKVEKYLLSSQALTDYWQQPVSAGQLQTEMERMAQHTGQPEVLRELFAVLGNDPFVIAECLARQILSERLVDAFSARGDEAGAEPFAFWRARAKSQTPSSVTAPAADYWLPPIVEPANRLTESTLFTTETIGGSPSIPRPANDTWRAMTNTNAPLVRADHTAIWTGSEMIVWGGSRPYRGTSNTGGKYTPSTDSWTTTSTINAPQARYIHTAVWTGSEMIVWGGIGSDTTSLGTGGRYNPSTDSWTPTSMTNAPSGRYHHTAVWTGTEMIIWAGILTDTGARYKPSTDTWTTTSTLNAPSSRENPSAVWTGSEMVVWGGWGGPTALGLDTGGKYNPNTNSWTAMSVANAPKGRDGHAAFWTGREMIVWGGEFLDVGSSRFRGYNTGGKYDPMTDTWTATSMVNAPVVRMGPSVVWTGSEIIVWGGVNDDGNSNLNTGGRYDPRTDNWTTISTTNAPSARSYHSAVWIGNEMIVWGGFSGENFRSSVVCNTGGRYFARP